MRKDKCVVITATALEYKQFLREQGGGNNHDYFYIGPEREAKKRIRGYRGLNFVLAGRWLFRNDLKEIGDILYMNNIGTELEKRSNHFREKVSYEIRS